MFHAEATITKNDVLFKIPDSKQEGGFLKGGCQGAADRE